MAGMPCPRTLEDAVEVVTRFPIEQRARAAIVRVHLGWITGTARAVFRRELDTADPLRSLDDFSRGRTAAGADVHDGRVAALAEVVEREHVRGREVVDVDVVANRRAVG